MSKLKVAVVGATGNVGTLMVDLLPDYFLENLTIIPVASEKSIGGYIDSKMGKLALCSMEASLKLKPHFALFSAGASVSLTHAADYNSRGTYVIDNSSAWRMAPNIPLIVPEINSQSLSAGDALIANPNCAAIQLVLVLDQLEKKYGLERVVFTSFQSVSGAGKDALYQMDQEREGASLNGPRPLKKSIDQNVIPQIDVFRENGYTNEEWKVMEESRKILSLPNLKITTTCVRVPVRVGHSESVNIQLNSSFEVSEVRKLLAEADGIKVLDDPTNLVYPMPKDSEGKDDVFVGRIRRDESVANGLNLWIVADNLRKGAATNALQIAKYIFDKGWLGVG